MKKDLVIVVTVVVEVTAGCEATESEKAGRVKRHQTETRKANANAPST